MSQLFSVQPMLTVILFKATLQSYMVLHTCDCLTCCLTCYILTYMLSYFFFQQELKRQFCILGNSWCSGHVPLAV